MREHEVPTHVQTEDKVLLWFTFPQIAAMLAAAGLAYALWRYAPGPQGFRIALAAAAALLGAAAAAGKIGGRRLPMMAADLLRFHLTPRRYQGPPSELARSEPPAAVEKRPSRLTAFARRMKAGANALRSRRRAPRTDRKRKTKGERRPFRPHARFGKGRKTHAAVLAATALAAMTVMTANPQRTDADEPPPNENWEWLDGIEFQPQEPIPGRRLFIDGIAASNGRTTVGLRAATDIDLHVHASGGPQGSRSLFSASAALQQGERVQYDLPLDGPRPSLEFSWQDSRAQAGTLALDDDRLPYPLPSERGRLCSIAVQSIQWTPGKIQGVVSSRCAANAKEAAQIQTAAGHRAQTVTALLDAKLTSIAGTIAVEVSNGGTPARTTAPFAANADTPFSVPIQDERTIRRVDIRADIEATAEITLPPLVSLSHHPHRIQRHYTSVSFTCPERTRSVSIPVSYPNPDGTWNYTYAYGNVSFPSYTVRRSYSSSVSYPEHVSADVLTRSPMIRRIAESLELALTIGTDDPYQALELPAEHEPQKAEQTPLTEEQALEIFGVFDWRYALW